MLISWAISWSPPCPLGFGMKSDLWLDGCGSVCVPLRGRGQAQTVLTVCSCYLSFLHLSWFPHAGGAHGAWALQCSEGAAPVTPSPGTWTAHCMDGGGSGGPGPQPPAVPGILKAFSRPTKPFFLLSLPGPSLLPPYQAWFFSGPRAFLTVLVVTSLALALGNESRPGVYQTPCKTEIPLGKGSKVVIFFQQASQKQVKLKHLFIPTASQGTLNVKSALRVKTWSLPLVPLSLVNLQPFP